jgi:hypothetical protein
VLVCCDVRQAADCNQAVDRLTCVTWQTDARGEAHCIGLLASIRSSGAVEPGKTVVSRASQRDIVHSSLSNRHIVVRRCNRENHQNGNQNKRETAAHGQRSCA